MGRTLITFRWLFEGEKDNYIRQYKRTPYFVYVEKLLSNAMWFNDAATNWSNGLIKEKILFVILLGQYKEILQGEK